ncbi:DUF2510 domain-containing protein [Microbacterium invictum]|uniref:DUF2510 domain-containing protein n=1 Tax=Microbacterium invictum TaxID=515415 RepID=A0ABZ0VCK0_9MICO|nr:DUF2510 domain-containing protein [Microbacterium invictum]WQB71352.1 DUF2510 domain-containing protein [Microbacterium invictum]
MTTNPPGWYDYGPGTRRWWDGAKWTEHVQSTEGGTDAAPAAGSDQGEVAPSDPAAIAANDPAPLPQDGGGYATAGPPPSAPGFAGAPGYAPAGGAFTAATDPKKSKLWILWVVLGVVLLGIVIAAAVLIPILIGVFSAAGGVDEADQQDAVRAVELYDEAWREGDCDKYLEATSEGFREASGLPDCAAFDEQAAGFAASVQNYQTEVVGITVEESTVFVDTAETYESFFTAEGEPVETPVPIEESWQYTVIEIDGAWVIDNAYYDE